jgi:hypothetical protein
MKDDVFRMAKTVVLGTIGAGALILIAMLEAYLILITLRAILG